MHLQDKRRPVVLNWKWLTGLGLLLLAGCLTEAAVQEEPTAAGQLGEFVGGFIRQILAALLL